MHPKSCHLPLLQEWAHDPGQAPYSWSNQRSSLGLTHGEWEEDATCSLRSCWAVADCGYVLFHVVTTQLNWKIQSSPQSKVKTDADENCSRRKLEKAPAESTRLGSLPPFLYFWGLHSSSPSESHFWVTSLEMGLPDYHNSIQEK